MMPHYTLIASFVHGNALGVVLEPWGHTGKMTPQERAHIWSVRIGPLVPEAAVGTEFPTEDYELVVQDLRAFCERHCIEPLPGSEHAPPQSNRFHFHWWFSKDRNDDRGTAC